MCSNVWSFKAVPASVTAARTAIRAVADEHDVDDETRDAMAMCVTEAVTNAVVHAYRGRRQPGQVELQVDHVAGGLCVYVRDDGGGLATAADSEGLGLGLPLMSQLSERFEVRPRDAGGTEIMMRFSVA